MYYSSPTGFYIYYDVSYENKHIAKEQKMRYDIEKKAWYIQYNLYDIGSCYSYNEMKRAIKKSLKLEERIFRFEIKSIRFYSNYIDNTIFGNRTNPKYKTIDDYIMFAFNKQKKRFLKLKYNNINEIDFLYAIAGFE